MYKRVVFKISGEALANHTEDPFDNAYIDELSDEIIAIAKRGIDVSLIIGGGNIWRGALGSFMENDSRSHQIGMLATVQNALFMQCVFEKKGVGSAVLTPFPVSTFTEQYSLLTCERAFAEHKIVIFAGGLGHPFFSTDSVTALRAIEIGADGLFYTKNGVEGIYDKDPNKEKDAAMFTTISAVDALQNGNIRIMDKAALALLLENKVDFRVIGLTKGNLLKAIAGETIGTLVTYKE